MRTQTVVPGGRRFNALVTCTIANGAFADIKLTLVAVVAVRALTPCFMIALFVVTSSTILTRVACFTAIIVLTVLAGEVSRAATHVAVSLVDARAAVQTGHAIFASSRVVLTVKQA